MKTKFALVRYSGKEELNTALMQKISKCQDVVMLKFDYKNKRRNKIKYKSIVENNWSEIPNHDLVDADLYLKKAISTVANLSYWADDDLCRIYSQEIFMFSKDANLSYISLMKEENMHIYAFELTKKSFEKLIEAKEFVNACDLLKSSYVGNDRNRKFVLSKIVFDDISLNYISNEIAKIESEIIERCDSIFESSLKHVKKILLSGWK